MSPLQRKATMRMVVASFAAGASAMLLVGLVAPLAMQSGLSVREAFAATVEQRAPAIEPLNVAAIEAQLAAADEQMASMRASTADEVAQLDRLSGR
jgi:hypothetical protein